MKKAITLASLLYLIHILPAQQVINNILLPDSLGSISDGVFSCVYNETNNCIYVGGGDFVFVLDGVTDQRIARIPVTGTVTSMLWVPGENKIFCAHYDDARVTVIDGASNSLITTLPVGVFPFCLEYNATNNKVYCANKHSRDITVIDAAGNSVITTMPFPVEPSGMVWNAANNLLWCVGGEWYSVYYGNTNSVYYENNFPNSDFSDIIWTATSQYISDRAKDVVNWGVMVGDMPTDLVWNSTSNKVYCANNGSDNVSVIDEVTSSVIATIPVGDAPGSLCWNSVENKVYCLNFGSSDITIIDAVTDTVITTVQLRGYIGNGTGIKPHLTLNIQNDKLYALGQSCREVTIIDGSSNTITGDVILGASPWALAWNSTSNKLYSANWSSSNYYSEGNISIIDGISQVPISTLPVGAGPVKMVWNSTNNNIYCLNTESNNVSVIDGISDQIIETIEVGAVPKALVWNATSNKIYFANRNGNSVSIINGANNTLLATVPVGGWPEALTWNSTNNKVYCANSSSANVSVIDGFSNNVIATIPIGNGPRNLLWNATGNKIYCTNSNGLSIIDGMMDTVITDIPMYGPYITLIWNATNNKIYCNLEQDNSVIVIDGQSDQILNTLELESLMNVNLFWNSSDNRLYCYVLDNAVSYPYPGKLIVIDGVSDSVITTLSLGECDLIPYDSPPECFTADIVGNRVFFADFNKSRISVIDPTATGIISEPMAQIPEKFYLHQNYPNPFNPSTTIKFDLPSASKVTLKIFNILGKEITTLQAGRLPAGSYSYEWDASAVASGVYLYRLQAGNYVETRKMILMK